MKVILLIIASQGYQPIEYGHTRQALEDAGIKVVVASDKSGQAHASVAGTKYSTVNVDLVLQDVKSDEYDGIFIIGGPGALNNLDNNTTYSIMQSAAKQNKAFGAICISPRILAKANLLSGKKATGWDEDNLLGGIFKKYNVHYIKDPVVVDGKIITANGPSSAKQFGKAIANLFN